MKQTHINKYLMNQICLMPWDAIFLISLSNNKYVNQMKFQKCLVVNCHFYIDFFSKVFGEIIKFQYHCNHMIKIY